MLIAIITTAIQAKNATAKTVIIDNGTAKIVFNIINKSNKSERIVIIPFLLLYFTLFIKKNKAYIRYALKIYINNLMNNHRRNNL